VQLQAKYYIFTSADTSLTLIWFLFRFWYQRITAFHRVLATMNYHRMWTPVIYFPSSLLIGIWLILIW